MPWEFFFIFIFFIKACHYTAWHIEGGVDSYTHTLHSHEEVCTHTHTHTKRHSEIETGSDKVVPRLKVIICCFFKKKIRRFLFSNLHERSIDNDIGRRVLFYGLQ